MWWIAGQLVDVHFYPALQVLLTSWTAKQLNVLDTHTHQVQVTFTSTALRVCAQLIGCQSDGDTTCDLPVPSSSLSLKQACNGCCGPGYLELKNYRR